MTAWCEAILAAFLLTDLMLAASSRLLHCIRIVAVQGILLGILPLVVRAWSEVHPEQIWVALLNIGIKGGGASAAADSGDAAGSCAA